jgi:hypothetical protein
MPEATPTRVTEEKLRFTIRILGRTLEHLGVQMYKRRDAAIAELVANCWDAGSTEVNIEVPGTEDYDKQNSRIVIRDSGDGMNQGTIQDAYLVVGRNRRQTDGEEIKGRPLMGRKGIGKLAGFGIADSMKITTWQSESEIELELKTEMLKLADNEVQDVPLEGTRRAKAERPSVTGTEIVLASLKHSTPINANALVASLARRFSRRIRGEMSIFVNDEKVGDPKYDAELKYPAEKEYEEHKLPSGDVVKYSYLFSKKPIPLKEMSGFAVLVRGKTAQAPPFYFGVDQKASGQHGTKYVAGIIEADFLDSGTDDESDIIATDRQEVDWEQDRSRELMEWGEELSRKVLRAWADRRGKDLVDQIFEVPEIKERIERLEVPLQAKLKSWVRSLSKYDEELDRLLELSGSLIKVFEYRHFHDALGRLDEVAEDPEKLHDLLVVLDEWKVLESRAILEVIQGRLSILDKFEKAIIEGLRETAHHVGENSIHDYLARFPWILNPEWQVLSEEKRISTLLRDWLKEDLENPDDLERYDFLAYSDDQTLVVIEIKRSDHAVTYDELQRLEGYKEKLGRARPNIVMVMICSGANISAAMEKNWEERDDGEIRPWSSITQRTRQVYEHYRALLEGDVANKDFAEREREVAQARKVIQAESVYRNKTERAKGLGPQDKIKQPDNEDAKPRLTAKRAIPKKKTE